MNITNNNTHGDLEVRRLTSSKVTKSSQSQKKFKFAKNMDRRKRIEEKRRRLAELRRRKAEKAKQKKVVYVHSFLLP